MSNAKGAPRKRKANGYKFPDKLPKGEILRDTSKKDWILGESIGQGGFGEIYCAAAADKKTEWTFVVKIEPHENGPLFMEKNFYIKVAKPDDIKAWKQKEALKTLGMPSYIGSGTHFFKETKYRFLVMERFGDDLHSLFLSAKTFPPHTVYKCALQIIDTLRYIHSKEYVHCDIKGANLLLGRKPGTENTVFLVDFGLACKYSQKEFQRDPKQVHNGTIEFTSCDMHLGVPTRRGDLEILGYNLLQWLAGKLPWEKDIANKETVHKKKQELMSAPDSYIKKNFPGVSQVMIAYMTYVSKLKHNEEPNYKNLKDMLTKELKLIGSPPNGPLEFKPSNKSGVVPKKTRGRKPTAPAVKELSGSDTEGPDLSPIRGRAKATNLPQAEDKNVAPAAVPKKARGRKPKASVVKEVSGSETEGPDLSPIRGEAEAMNLPESDDENMAPAMVPKKTRGRKQKAPAVKELSGSDSEEMELSPVRGVSKATKKAATSVELDNPSAKRKPRKALLPSGDLDDEEPEISPILPVKPSSRGRKPEELNEPATTKRKLRAAQPPPPKVEDSDTDDPELSPVKRRAKTTQKTTKRTKTATTAKPNWKDAPGVQWQLKNIPR